MGVRGCEPHLLLLSSTSLEGETAFIPMVADRHVVQKPLGLRSASFQSQTGLSHHKGVQTQEQEALKTTQFTIFKLFILLSIVFDLCSFKKNL